MFIVGALLVFVALLANEQSLPIRLAVKTIALFLFPILLYPFNFYEQVELDQIRAICLKWRNPRRWNSNLKDLFN
jgi:hypothetical protein